MTINIAYHVGVVQKLFSPKSSLAEEKRIQSINQSMNLLKYVLLTDTLLGSSSTTLYQVGRVVRVGGPVQGLNGFLVVLVMIRYMHLSKWLFNTGLILEYFIKSYRTKNFRIEVLFFSPLQELAGRPIYVQVYDVFL